MAVTRLEKKSSPATPAISPEKLEALRTRFIAAVTYERVIKVADEEIETVGDAKALQEILEEAEKDGCVKEILETPVEDKNALDFLCDLGNAGNEDAIDVLLKYHKRLPENVLQTTVKANRYSATKVLLESTSPDLKENKQVRSCVRDALPMFSVAVAGIIADYFQKPYSISSNFGLSSKIDQFSSAAKLASKLGHVECAVVLHRFGADPSVVPKAEVSKIYSVARQLGSFDAIAQVWFEKFTEVKEKALPFVDSESESNTQDSEGNTLLHHLVQVRASPISKFYSRERQPGFIHPIEYYLLKFRDHLNVENHWGRTPLDCALEPLIVSNVIILTKAHCNGRIALETLEPIFSRLMNKGDLTLAVNLLWSWYCWTDASGRVISNDILKTLIDKYKKVTDWRGNTLLHQTVRGRHFHNDFERLFAGCTQALENEERDTPLKLAVKMSYTQAIFSLTSQLFLQRIDYASETSPPPASGSDDEKNVPRRASSEGAIVAPKTNPDLLNDLAKFLLEIFQDRESAPAVVPYFLYHCRVRYPSIQLAELARHRVFASTSFIEFIDRVNQNHETVLTGLINLQSKETRKELSFEWQRIIDLMKELIALNADVTSQKHFDKPLLSYVDTLESYNVLVNCIRREHWDYPEADNPALRKLLVFPGYSADCMAPAVDLIVKGLNIGPNFSCRNWGESSFLLGCSNLYPGNNLSHAKRLLEVYPETRGSIRHNENEVFKQFSEKNDFEWIVRLIIQHFGTDTETISRILMLAPQDKLQELFNSLDATDSFRTALQTVREEHAQRSQMTFVFAPLSFKSKRSKKDNETKGERVIPEEVDTRELDHLAKCEIEGPFSLDDLQRNFRTAIESRVEKVNANDKFSFTFTGRAELLSVHLKLARDAKCIAAVVRTSIQGMTALQFLSLPNKKPTRETVHLLLVAGLSPLERVAASQENALILAVKSREFALVRMFLEHILKTNPHDQSLKPTLVKAIRTAEAEKFVRIAAFLKETAKNLELRMGPVPIAQELSTSLISTNDRHVPGLRFIDARRVAPIASLSLEVVHQAETKCQNLN